MKWVAFVPLLKEETKFLELCSALTPLVEPVQGGVFLDLAGCGSREAVFRRLADARRACADPPLYAGFSNSKALARIASCWPVLLNRPSACRLTPLEGGGRIVEVETGRERDFIGELKLEDFPGFTNTQVKRLKRAGFTKVGELQDLSARQLSRILGAKDLSGLERSLNASDEEMVLGTYPPERLFYREIFPDEIRDGHRLDQSLRKATVVLGKCLVERHVSARHIFLWVEESGRSNRPVERRLQIGCADSDRMLRLVTGMLESQQLESAVSSLEICLGGLETVCFEQPGLFAMQSRQAEPVWREVFLADSVEKLLERFPEAINRGIRLDRREEILAFWDPWRFEDNPA